MARSADDFRKLSVPERIQLVEDIWDSIATENPESVELTPAQRLEIRRRMRAHREDPSTALPWEQVRAELLKRLS